MSRAYLDWNATAPLRPEARAAMVAAMDAVGNPSSVHAEGRAARAIVERARAQVAQAFGAADADIVFTSGATEAAALAMAGRALAVSAVEHDAVHSHGHDRLAVDATGRVTVEEPAASALQLANPETGIVQELPEGLAMTDAVQAAGKIPFAFSWCGADMAIISAHKFGGPKGVGALILRRGVDVATQLTGGGQEMGRRSGTENVIGIAGMGAAALAAMHELDAGRWDEVAALRDRLEEGIRNTAPEAIIVGAGAARLPNTSCIVVPGWK
ncbi:MAG: aminotransferase class V-fold PLP-dependent enzyme, partial [Alphaproteobacteria bacterium]